MSNRKQRIVFGVSATLAGLAMFVVASAYIVSRGLPHWLAAAVGGFAFPVAPVAWQVVSERRRTKRLAGAKVPQKASLTAGDRFWLRLLAVALLVLGPMIAIGRFNVVRAIWHHGLWFWPTSYEPATSHGGPLSTLGSGPQRAVDVFGTPLARVPSDAELVILVDPPADMKADGRGVFAWGDRQLLLVAEGKVVDDKASPEELAKVNKELREKAPWLAFDDIVEVKRSESLYVAASEGWRFRVDPPGAGPSAELIRELGRAPKDAFITAAFVPKTTRDVLSTRAGAAWLLKRGEKLVVEGRIEANDEAAAKRFVDEAKRALDKAAHDVPESCREEVGKIIKATQLDQTGAIVTGRLEIEGDALIGVLFCSLKG